MKISVFCRGLGHSLRLAEQLHSNGSLQNVISGYPRFKLRHFCLPPDKIVSLRTALGQEAVRRMPLIGHYLVPSSDYWNRMVFDRLAARFIRGSDIAIVWMHSTPYLIRQIKQHGAVAVLECGAVHSGYLRQVLEEQYERLGLKFTDRRSTIFWPPSFRAELAQYDEADYLEVPSEFARQSFLSKGISPQKLLKAPYGTDCESFQPVAKVDGVFRAMYVGLLSVLKGVPVLLEAWRRLKWGTTAELALVGNASLELSAALRKPIPGVRLFGRVDHWNLYRVYSQASVFVFPSWGDGWPLVVGEAMACGLPVICTPNSGACELVRDGIEGFVVPAGDADALAERISFLRANDEIRQEMGTAARRRAELYSWERYGERVTQNYSAALAGRVAECVEQVK